MFAGVQPGGGCPVGRVGGEGTGGVGGRDGVVVRFSLLSGAPVSLGLRACLLPTRRCVSGADQRGARQDRLWMKQGGKHTAAGCAVCSVQCVVGSRQAADAPVEVEVELGGRLWLGALLTGREWQRGPTDSGTCEKSSGRGAGVLRRTMAAKRRLHATKQQIAPDEMALRVSEVVKEREDDCR
jgi:hypothetical protein